MAERETVDVADSMFGEKLYQRRARLAFPLLVRQAWAQNTIYYQQLAEELEMENARNLNYVLGSIGTTLLELGAEWDEAIPKIQSLVINQGSGQPGTGYFGGEEAYHRLSKRQREAFLQSQRAEIFAYPKWTEVLDALELEPPQVFGDDLIQAAAMHSGGEGEEHRKLKFAIANDPTLIDLPRSTECLGVEFRIPSGDSVDVLLKHQETLYAIEVKPTGTMLPDLVRGLFQCIKYQAVLDAWSGVKEEPFDVVALLVLGGELPKEIHPLRNTLQIMVHESVHVA